LFSSLDRSLVHGTITDRDVGQALSDELQEPAY